MVSQPNDIAHINGDILALAGYYTSNDSTQHVLVAATDGNLYEVHWNQSVPVTVSNSFARFNNLVAMTGFYSPDDQYQHAITATSDTTLHERYFTQPGSPGSRDPLYHVGSMYPSNGTASYYSPGDNLRHVAIVDTNGNPQIVTWGAQQGPGAKGIITPVSSSDIASIAGFLATDDNTRHIIVALKNGEVYDIHYTSEQTVPTSIDQSYLITNFNEPVQNVTAFFSPDTNYRHIVVFTGANILKDHSYNTGGQTRNTVLSSALSNVADITSYYSAYDNIRHVIFGTHDGHLHEITYTSQG